jgi:hypothetical protein
MGQAKRRGTYEERKSNPLGDSPKYKYWTEERIERFKQEFINENGEYIYQLQQSLFGPSKPRKKKARRIKTGG